MQQRFCECGHAVLVRYVFGKGAWTPIVHAGRIECLTRLGLKGGFAASCPSCGRSLDIDTLH